MKAIHYRIIMLAAAAAVIFTACGTMTEAIRSHFPKISEPATADNFSKFEKSSFKNYFIYKKTLKSDFRIDYFTSYYASGTGSTTQIISSEVSPGENFVTLGNIFGNAYQVKDGKTSLVSYLLMHEGLISKSVTLEMTFGQADIKTGFLKGTSSNHAVSIVLKNEKGKTLFDLSDPKCWINVEITSVNQNIIEGTFSARLVGQKRAEFLDLREGRFWVKK